MKKTIQILLMVLLVATVAFAQEAKQPRLITVTGTSEVSVTPDVVVIDLGVESRQTNLELAKSRVDNVVRSVIHQAREFGIENKDVQVSQLSIQPSYGKEDSGKTVSYYEVSNSITVRLNDLKHYDDFMTAVIKAGVNQVNATSFQSTQAFKKKAEAQQMAIAAAREKADAIASQLGLKLGRVNSVTEQSAGIFLVTKAGANTRSYEGDSTALGSISISSSVFISFEIE